MWNRIANRNQVLKDFPGGPAVKNPPSNSGETGSIPGPGTKIPTCCRATKPPSCNKNPVQPEKRNAELCYAPSTNANSR